ncbi:phosphotransferase [Candidatus Falkowbacteria bacterium]|nr:phosphotransferase [Candidatus Falkowbacteria bacterium]
MNVILRLLEEKYVQALFDKNVLPQYEGATDIRLDRISPVKKMIWHTTYHVVFRYDATLTKSSGQTEKIEIYCSAHSSEPRKIVYEVLRYLWGRDFAEGDLTIPKPLFYSKKFNAAFYQGMVGVNLYNFIKNNDYAEVERLLPLTAAWFAKLHSLPVRKNKLFLQPNSRIATVFPGAEHVLAEVKNRCPENYGLYQAFYQRFTQSENQIFAEKRHLRLIHGDAHPENVIRLNDGRIGVVDFTDMSLGDVARDLGTFLQQLEFMTERKMDNPDFAKKAMGIFLSSYLRESGLKMSDNLQERMDIYYNWTTIRTASYFLLKHDPQPERAEPMIASVAKNLKIIS